MKTIIPVPYLILALSFNSRGEEPRLARSGKFDSSTEELATRFTQLREGMSVTKLKKIFPDHVKWSLHAINRHYEQEICFQWQTEVFFIFAFKNTTPQIDGKPHRPEENSTEWSFSGAYVVKMNVGVKDGLQSLEKTWDSPSITYVFPPR